VAAGINTLICTHQLQPEAKSTADFIEKVDSLFDMLNSTKPFGEKPARCAITANNDVADQLLRMKDWIGHWKFQGVRSMSAIKCVWGLQTTISSIVALSHDLLSEGFRFVCTARFNQDCIENFFAGIRNKQGWNENPNAEQFGFAFRKAIVLSSLDASSAGRNCISDDDFTLVNHADLVHSVTNIPDGAAAGDNCPIIPVPEQHSGGVVGDPDCSSMDSELLHFDVPCSDVEVEMFTEGEESLISYLAGWVARKVGICRQCQEVLARTETEHSYACRQQDIFSSKKRYGSACSVGLVLPCPELSQQVWIIEQQFRVRFSELKTTCNIAQKLYDYIFPLCDFDFLYTRHPVHALYLSQKITKLYIIMRLFYAVKFVNRDSAAQKTKSGQVKSVRRFDSTRKMQKVLHK